MVIYVVKAVFRPGLLAWRNPAKARVTRLSGLRLFLPWMERRTLPKQARYQLRYTRLLSCFIRLGVFTQSGAKQPALRFAEKLFALLYRKPREYVKNYCMILTSKTKSAASRDPLLFRSPARIWISSGSCAPRRNCCMRRRSTLFTVPLLLTSPGTINT